VQVLVQAVVQALLARFGMLVHRLAPVNTDYRDSRELVPPGVIARIDRIRADANGFRPHIARFPLASKWLLLKVPPASPAYFQLSFFLPSLLGFREAAEVVLMCVKGERSGARTDYGHFSSRQYFKERDGPACGGTAHADDNTTSADVCK
jgi:hypothetical protein